MLFNWKTKSFGRQIFSSPTTVDTRVLFFGFFWLKLRTSCLHHIFPRSISEIYFGWCKLLQHFHKIYFYELFTWCYHVSENITSLDLIAAKRFLYFSHILLNFWMVRWHFFLAFKKPNNMSFKDSAFYFLADIILGARMMMCPKLIYCCHNHLTIYSDVLQQILLKFSDLMWSESYVWYFFACLQSGYNKSHT